MTAFRAPGIIIKEKDVSEVIGNASTSVGALVGPAYKGPASRRVLISDAGQFANVFGTPLSATENEYSYYSAFEYLKESNALYFVRTVTSADTYGGTVVTSAAACSAITLAATETETVLTQSGYEDGNKADAIYDLDGKATAAQPVKVFYANPSSDSLNVAIAVVTPQSSASTSGSNFPFGYNWSGSYTNPEKLYRINVYTKDSKTSTSEAGWVTGVSAISAVSPAESFIVSNDPNLKDDSGVSLYARDVINGKSNYIYVSVLDGKDISAYDTASKGIVQMGAGVGTLDMSGVEGGWDLFLDKENSTPNVLLAPYNPSSANQSLIARVGAIASTRKDCFAVAQVGERSVTDVEAIVNAAGVLRPTNPSYGALYAGWDLIYDKYTDKTLYIPKAIFGAALLARTDAVANTWDAPAGLNRGIISSLGQFKSFNETEIGYLQNYSINTSKNVRGTGTVMWGQKTAQVKKSALDRINVRRLLLFIENSIEPGLLSYLFEPNNEKVRSRVTYNLESFMRGVAAQGGVYAYQVVCDETNNTSQVIDNNELAISLFVQPTKTIEFINVTVVITRTGVNFAEVA